MNTLLFPPKAIELHTKSSEVRITWNTGKTDSLSTADLRQFCACSTCRAKKLVGVELIDAITEIKNIYPMGSSGIQIEFADGHDRGVFPWPYLHAIVQGNALDFLFERNP